MNSSRIILERHLRQAILAALHELVPEFCAHVDACPNCGQFHDWVTWRHKDSTNEWRAVCPSTGEEMILPLELRSAA